MLNQYLSVYLPKKIEWNSNNLCLQFVSLSKYHHYEMNYFRKINGFVIKKVECMQIVLYSAKNASTLLLNDGEIMIMKWYPVRENFFANIFFCKVSFQTLVQNLI